jgi:hypothetical protein
MAASAKFRDQDLAVTDWILRLRRGAPGGQCGQQRNDRRQAFHQDIFIERKAPGPKPAEKLL